MSFFINKDMAKDSLETIKVLEQQVTQLKQMVTELQRQIVGLESRTNRVINDARNMRSDIINIQRTQTIRIHK
jgi:phage shock protein A